jgi:LPS-assembly protein
MSTITPFIDYQGAYWNRDDSADSSTENHGHAEVYSAGLLFETELRRTFQASLGNIDRIQHSIRPEISYTYSTSEGDGTMTDFAPPLFSEQSITYAVINVLTTRDHSAEGAVSYREWMRLKLAQTYYIQTSEKIGIPTTSYINHITNAETWLPISSDTKPFGDVQIELDVTPLDFFSFSARNLYNVDRESWDQANYNLSLKDHRGDTLSAGYSYTVDTVEEVDLSLTSALRNDLFATLILRQNLKDQLSIEHTYKLRYQKQCWSVEVSYSETVGDRSYNVLVSLYGLGRSSSK